MGGALEAMTGEARCPKGGGISEMTSEVNDALLSRYEHTRSAVHVSSGTDVQVHVHVHVHEV